MKQILSYIVLLLCGFVLCSQRLWAVDQRDLPEDFVTASIVITDPGEVLYSKAGHAFLRMQCPTHGLDFCFSYESEDVQEKVLSFLAGRLKMGMTAIPTNEYIKVYQEEGRGVYQYDLNLSIRVKQNLWRVLDQEVAKGMDQTYDYLERGCAISVLHVIDQALGTEQIDYGKWPDDINRMNRRELLSRQLDHAPWTRCVVNVLTNGSANDETDNPEKLVAPRDLVEQLQHATVDGRVLLSTTPIVLVPQTREAEDAGWFTPMVLAVVLLVITILCAFLHRREWDYVLLTIQALLGIVNVYLVCFSSLCGTEWSWLIIPFNPLPLVLWKWRRKWMPAYAFVIIGWMLYMCLAPHSLTDPAFIVLSGAISVNYLSNYFLLKRTQQTTGAPMSAVTLLTGKAPSKPGRRAMR